MFRQTIERLARKRVLRRYLPAAYGRIPFYASPDAQLKYIRPGVRAFDKDLLRIVSEYLKPGTNVWDIGANVGVFTFAAANIIHTGKVLAVEPDIWLAQLLSRSLTINQDKGFDVTILPVAISDEVGTETFLIAARGRASNALQSAGGSSQMGGIREVQTVPTLTLDILYKKTFRPDFIKVDVEGAEVKVLEGAQDVLSNARPEFYIEVGTQNQEAVTRIFRSFHYKILDGDTGKPVDTCAFNTIALPN
jgi:FkbM family methyltransferase